MVQSSRSGNHRAVRAIPAGAWARLSVVVLAGGVMTTLHAGATQVEPVESGTGAENARNTAQLTVASISGNINLRSFSLGGERAETTGARLTPKLLTIVKGTDSNTPRFFGLAATGQRITTMTLVSTAAGISQSVTYTFGNATIVAHRVSDRGRPTDAQALEEVTFSYTRLSISTAAPGAPTVTSCFDFASNTNCS